MGVLNKNILHGGDYNPDQWLDSPDILEKDIELMKKAGVNCVSMGIFAWSALEPEEGIYTFEWLGERIDTLHMNGIYTVLATPSGARPVWMAHKYPEVLRTAPDRKRNLMGGRHNHCNSSPVYREKVWQINKKLAENFANHPGVILWHLSNEYGGECYCELCHAAFREYLRKKHGTLKSLNKAWWTAFWSHTYTSWEQIEAPAPHGEFELHGLSLDWKRFNTELTVDFCAWEKAAVKAGGSLLPVTTNLMGFNNRLDYSKFDEVLDIISWDSYPQWHNNKMSDIDLAAITACTHDLMRCIRKDKAPFLLMETVPSAANWWAVGKLKRPGMHMLSSMQAIAHGSNSIQYFQWRKSRGSCEQFHGAVVDHSGSEEDRVFKDVAAVGGRLAGLDAVCASRVNARVAVIFDQGNRWMLEEAFGPRNVGIHYIETLQAHYAALWRKGIMMDVIDTSCELEGYKLVIAPMLYLQDNGIAEKMRAFVKNGGTLVGTYQSGIVDENNLCHLGAVPHDLTDVFGLVREEIDGLHDGEQNSMTWKNKTYLLTELCERLHPLTAQVLACYNEGFYKNGAVLCKNKFGKGTAYYIGAHVDAKFLNDFYNEVINCASVKPSIKAELPSGVTASTRSSSNREFVFLQNYNPVKKELTIDETENFTDFETGEKINGRLVLDGYGVRIFYRNSTELL